MMLAVAYTTYAERKIIGSTIRMIFATISINTCQPGGSQPHASMLVLIIQSITAMPSPE